MRQWVRRFRRQSEEDFVAEVEAHLAHETDEQIERGLSGEDAHYAALRRFGNLTRHLERYRESSPWFWFETVWQDVRYGWRSLRRSPALFLAAVVSLALGIGATTITFSVLDATVLNPFPYPHSERLATLVQLDRARGDSPTGDFAGVNATEFAEYGRLGEIFESVAGFGDLFAFVNRTDLPSVRVSRVTCNFFEVLGVSTQLGRAPRAADCRPAAQPIALLSHELWISRFAADPHVLGRTITVQYVGGETNTERHLVVTVIGVMPPKVSVVREELWLPSDTDAAGRNERSYCILARLRDAADLKQGDARVRAVSTRLASAFPADHAHDAGPYGLTRLRDQTVGGYETTMYALMAAVTCVLVIACLNVATLSLARATARQTELGMRVSLGASFGRILRQLMIESIVLAVCGGLVGIVLSAAIITPLSRLLLATEMVAPQANLQLSLTTFVVAAIASAFAAVVFGAAPAIQTLRGDPARVLLSGMRSTPSAATTRSRAALVAAQVALALPTLCVTAALVQSFGALGAAAARYEPKHVLGVVITLPQDRYPTFERRQQFYRELDQVIGAIPGVTGVASTAPFLLFRGEWWTLQPEGHADAREWRAQVRSASPGFFTTLRIPVLKGRTFEDADQYSSRRVVVVSRSFASTYLGTESPIGRRFRVKEGPDYIFRPSGLGHEPLEIIGVVDDIRMPDVLDVNAEAIAPSLFVPQSLVNHDWAHVLIRTAVPPRSVDRDVRRAIASLDPSLMGDTHVLHDAIDGLWIAWPRLLVGVAVTFGGAGLVLALVGLFGVLSYSVALISREIGVCLALGASPAHIGRQVLGRALRWTFIGLAAGVVATLAADAVLRSRIWGVATLDLRLLGSVAGLVILAAVMTCWFPIRRAMRVDPVTVLRAE